MAKRGTLTHRKTRWLAKALGVPLPYALGIMEALWHTAAEQTPAGDIGHLSNKAIASECYFDGDPDALVRALVEAELLDDDLPGVRLFIHGWHEHADNAVHKFLLSKRMYFANGAMPILRHDMFDHKVRSRIEAEYRKQELPGLGELPDTSGSNLGDIGEESQEGGGVIPTIPLPLPKAIENPPKAPSAESAKPARRTRRGATGPEPPWFEKWWLEFANLYPLRGGGAICWAEGRKKLAAIAAGGEEVMAPILAGVRRFKLWADTTGKTGTDEGVCALTTWVNQRRWLETYDVPIRKGFGDSKASNPPRRGPIKGVHWEERAMPGADGVPRLAKVVIGTDQPIDRSWAFEFFDREDGASDWREACELWCGANGLPPDDGFMDEVKAA